MKNITHSSLFEPDAVSRASIETMSIHELIEEHKKVSDKLERVAEAKPSTAREMRDIIDHEAMLLDMQAEILGSALSAKPKNMEDAKALLWLWHHEVVDTQSPCSLSESDKIIVSVCKYLGVK